MDEESLEDRLQREVDETNADLLAKEREKRDLVRKVEFEVSAYTCVVSSGSITPVSEFRVGGQSSSYRTGQSYRSVINVEPSDSGIEKVVYPGQLPLEKGDRFYAWIIVGEEKRFESPPFTSGSGMRKVWVPRDYQPKERAFKIAKLRDGQEVAVFIDGNIKI